MNKIANIIEDGRLGGPQVRIVEVAKKLRGTDFETTVILPKIDNERFIKKLKTYKIKYKELPIHRLTKEKKHLFIFVVMFFYETFTLYKYLKNENFSLIHVSGGSWQWKGVIAGKMAGIKVIWHLNDTNIPFYIKFIFSILVKNFTDSIIVAGSSVGKYYLKHINVKHKLTQEIQAPVDCSIFNDSEVIPDSKMANYPGLKIVTVANINPIKGIEAFIKMASLVDTNESNISFIIVGPVYTSQKEYYEILLALKSKLEISNLFFYGSSDNVKSILKSSDIYVCSSIAEASPVSVWEAMSMSKAVITTNVGDVHKFIESGVNGYICPVNDHASMAKKLQNIINKPDLITEFGCKARETAIKYLNIDNCVELHENIYKATLNQ